MNKEKPRTIRLSREIVTTENHDLPPFSDEKFAVIVLVSNSDGIGHTPKVIAMVADRAVAHDVRKSAVDRMKLPTYLVDAQKGKTIMGPPRGEGFNRFFFMSEGT